ncbi:MAG: PIN domain nuclease [Spirochaetales bacterium]|nr:PIN domain nuclease [Spirochaetales bacterium]
MILIDTSVLIDYLKGKENTATEKFQEILDLSIPFGINSLIFQEVLQGARNEEEYKKLKEYLETLDFYELTKGRSSYEEAAYLNFLCRRVGITVRSTIDLLIAQTAIEHAVPLLHNDSDFNNIAKVIKTLLIYL